MLAFGSGGKVQAWPRPPGLAWILDRKALEVVLDGSKAGNSGLGVGRFGGMGSPFHPLALKSWPQKHRRQPGHLVGCTHSPVGSS